MLRAPISSASIRVHSRFPKPSPFRRSLCSLRSLRLTTPSPFLSCPFAVPAFAVRELSAIAATHRVALRFLRAFAASREIKPCLSFMSFVPFVVQAFAVSRPLRLCAFAFRATTAQPTPIHSSTPRRQDATKTGRSLRSLPVQQAVDVRTPCSPDAPRSDIIRVHPRFPKPSPFRRSLCSLRSLRLTTPLPFRRTPVVPFAPFRGPGLCRPRALGHCCDSQNRALFPSRLRGFA